MPYIKQEDRIKFKNILKQIVTCTPGELNYLITKICDLYIKDRGEKYQHYNDVIGMLECCKLEYYRKKVSKYENKKEKENGKV